MNFITYSLWGNKEDSNEYYSRIQRISQKVIKMINEKAKEYISEYKGFVYDEWVEEVRSNEEYGIEVLYIGVVLQEYIDYARAFKEKSDLKFKILNNLRQFERCKHPVDKIRGRLVSKILIEEQEDLGSVTLDDYKALIKWMEACGDFKEEIIRLQYWLLFLEKKNDEYIKNFFFLCDDLAVEFYNQCKGTLGKYTENVGEFLRDHSKKYHNREDLIYSGKGEIQYFYNMVSAEIVNNVYTERFKKCEKKMMILPSCMRQNNSKCCSEKTPKGYKCKGCNIDCNVNKLSKLGKKWGFEVYTIDHESSLFNEEDDENKSIGVVGVACVLNLISGGWKALRIGFIPQCIVLDYSGCKAHWLTESQMTSINYNKLVKTF